jgi:CRISPR-associated protein (TIGR03986 family)
MTRKEAIDSPYNFVPLATQVVCPEWGEQVSHDLPFRDGLSGELTFTLTAHAPLLVGGEQRKAGEGESGEVAFFRAPDGRYAIPGTSLKGMLRAVTEIATFSRLRLLDDKRYGLRDISGRHVAESYAARVRNRVTPGFLQLNDEGRPEIVPCSMARLSHRDLEAWWGERRPIFTAGKCRAVAEKYRRWAELCRRHRLPNPHRVSCAVSDGEVTALGRGLVKGMPVLTGQVSDSTHDGQRGRKYRDFLFYDPREAERFVLGEVDPRAWRDFLFIHGDEDGKRDMSWPGYWKQRFWGREQVPVFYIRSAGRLQIGLAFMPKLAGDYSIHDLVRHTSAEHLDDAGLDFATALFGRVGESADAALKGRVWVEPAFLDGEAKPEAQPFTILSGPKPTYFPNYVVQQAGNDSRLRPRAQYATYIETPGRPKPELRGWKRYPARPDGEVELQEPIGDQVVNKKIQVRLHTLPSGSRFRGRLVLHNLKREELGALLWAMTFGERPDCRHGLGMGKPFGFGQVSLEVSWRPEHLVPNDPAQGPSSREDCLAAFTAFMDKALEGSWADTPQIRALLAMADPSRRELFPGELRHMTLARLPDPASGGRKRNLNQFLEAKQQGLVLAGYSAGIATVASTPGEQWLQQQLKEIAAAQNTRPEEVLRGKKLAETWQGIEDAALKASALEAIERSWREVGLGWGDKKLKGASKKAFELYRA